MKNKSLILVIANTLSLLVMLFINYASNAEVFSNVTVTDISHKYDSLFAPAGYAFLIWAVIFLAAICFVIYQWLLLKKGDPKHYINRAGVWFAISNFANATWVYCWINEYMGWCVILILVLLLSLIILMKRLRLELDDEPVRIIFFVWWPIAFYLGWIMVATIACIASWLVSTAWSAFSISQNIWSIVMISIATLLYLVLIRKRNMRETSLVGSWAFIAIAVRQWHIHVDVAIIAVIFASVLIIASGIHGYKNKAYGIGPKLKRGEW